MHNPSTDALETKFYPFTNQFTFSMVMRDPAICKGLLDRILPNMQFGEVRTANVTTDEEILQTMQNLLLSIETKKVLELDPTAHGVRFDALVHDTEKWAEIEMQTYTGEHIGKRSRYYLSNVDMDAFAKGKSYSELPPTFMIFICTFDYMNAGKPMYFFRYFDEKNSLYLDDETYIIILNTKCDPGQVPDELKTLYAYINDPNRVEDEFIQQIEKRIRQYNSKKWRGIQVTLEEVLKHQVYMESKKAREEGHATGLAEGRTEGLEEGRAEGLAKGQDRVNQLNAKLFSLGRFEDAQKAAMDASYQEQLFAEFGL